MKSPSAVVVNRKERIRTTAPRWRRVARALCLTLLTILVVTATLVFIAIPALLRSGALTPFIEAKISTALGKRVAVGGLDLPDPYTLVVRDVVVADPADFIPRAEIALLRVTFSGLIAPLGTVAEIVVEDPSAIVNLDEATFRRLLAPRDGGGSPIDLSGIVKLPPIRVAGGCVRGTWIGRAYEISSLSGTIAPGTEGTSVPFAFTGRVAGAGPHSGVLSGRIDLAGTSSAVRIDELRMDDLHAKMGVGIANARIAEGRFDLDSFRIAGHLSQVLKKVFGIELQADIALSASIDLSGPGVERYELRGTVGDYAVASGNVVVKGEKSKSDFHGTLVRRLDRREVRLRAEVGNLDFTLPDGNDVVACGVTADLTMTPVDHGTTAKGRIRLDRCSFVSRSPEGEVSHLDAVIDVDLHLPENGEVIAGSARISLGNFEFLLSTARDAIYQDFAGRSIEILWNGTFDAAAGFLSIKEGVIALPDIGIVRVTGHAIRRKGYLLDISAVDLSTEAILARYGEMIPFLRDLKCRGKMSADLTFQGSPMGSSIDGTLSSAEMDVEWRGVAAKRLFFTLPLIVYSGDAQREEAEPRPGNVGWESLTLTSDGDAKPILTGAIFGLTATENGLTIAPPPPFPLFGGTVSADAVVIGGLPTHPRVSTSLTIDNVRLETLLRRFGIAKEIPGAVHASSLKFDFDGVDARLAGEIAVDAFGGTILLRDVALEQALGDFPTAAIREIVLREIHLREISRSVIDFGLIRGVVEGTIRDLRMFRETPISFEVNIRAVPREGIEQKMNSRTVKRLIFLASGNHSLWDYLKYKLTPNAFYYSHLGFYATLWNEQCYIRGRYYEDPATGAILTYSDETLRNGGRIEGAMEYLMVGTTLHRVNIINGAPGNTIPYEMLIERMRDLAAREGPTENDQ